MPEPTHWTIISRLLTVESCAAFLIAGVVFFMLMRWSEDER